MHKILEHDKQQGRKMGWHGLTDVKPDLTLKNCWLNEWDYVAERLSTPAGKKTPFYYLTVSDGAIVTKGYDENFNEIILPENEHHPLIVGLPYDASSFKPISNKKLIELLEKVTEGKDLTLASCGTVKNRGRQYFSFEMGESYRAGGREFVPYYNIGNGNDKSSPLWQNTSATCTVCDNTFEINRLFAGFIMEVKKTKFSDLKIGDFSQAAKAMLAGQKEFAQMFDKLALVKCDEQTAREFFAGFIGKLQKKALSTRAENIVARLVELYRGGAGNNGENFADVFSGATDFYTHESASGEGDEKANWKNFVSSEFGSARDEKIRVWATLNVDSQRDATIAIGKAILEETDKAKLAADKA